MAETELPNQQVPSNGQSEGQGQSQPQSQYSPQHSPSPQPMYSNVPIQPQVQPYQQYPPQGYTVQGYPPQGYAPQGYTAQGFPPQGYTAQGFPQGYIVQGNPPEGYSQGFPPQGYTAQGYPPQGSPTQGSPTQGQPQPQSTNQTVLINAGPIVVPQAQNAYLRELYNQRCCCGCCDIRTGVIVLSCALLFWSGISFTFPSYDDIYWSVVFNFVGCAVAGCCGLYGAYAYDSRFVLAMLIWLYIYVTVLVITILLIIILISAICIVACGDDGDSYNDTCEGVCYSILGVVAAYYGIVIIVHCYYLKVTHTFYRLLRNADLTGDVKPKY